jgi:hypothetical protein
VVDTKIRPPETPPSNGDTEAVRGPRRRWLRWVLLALAVLLIASGTTLTILVAVYQPFHAGYKQYGAPEGVSATVTRIDWLGAPPNVQSIHIPAQKGLTFDYRFSIWNHGPVSITVTQLGVPLDEQQGDGVTEVPVSINPDVYAYPPGGTWEPVRPVTLQPRQMMAVEMRVTVTSCMDRGAVTRWNSIPVSFTMFGIHRHVLAPTNVQINLVGTQPHC